MEWLRGILTGAGVENADAVIDEVKKTLPLHFVPKNVFNAKADEVKVLQGKIDSAPDYDGLKKQFDELQTKYDTDTKKLTDDLNGKDFSYAIELALSKSGAKSGKALRALIDESKLEYKDGKLTGFDEQLEEVKKEHGYLFGSSNTGLELGGGGKKEEDAFTKALNKAAGIE